MVLYFRNNTTYFYTHNEYVCFSVSRPACQCIDHSKKYNAFLICSSFLWVSSSLFHLLTFPLFRNVKLIMQISVTLEDDWIFFPHSTSLVYCICGISSKNRFLESRKKCVKWKKRSVCVLGLLYRLSRMCVGGLDTRVAMPRAFFSSETYRLYRHLNTSVIKCATSGWQ